RERQVLLLERMQRFNGYLRGRIIDVNGDRPEKITFGCSVAVVDDKSGANHTFNIVGPVEYELDLVSDMVTISAPMARLLMGKQVGDKVEVSFGSNAWTGTITSIKAIA